MRWFIAIAIILSMVVPRSAGAITAGEYCQESVESEFLQLLNEYRATQGAGPVVADQYMGAAAEHHTMLEAQYNMLFHDYPEIGFYWVQNIQQHGFSNTGWAAEITAGSYASASDTLNQFKNSPPHNEGMIDPKYVTVGISRYDDGGATQARYWWVIEFSSTPVKQPAVICGQPTPTVAPPTATFTPVDTPVPTPTKTPKPCHGNGRGCSSK